jgi:hypothetical protein
MKTTVELSDVLFEQAKAAARAQGITLKTLIESGLRMAIHARNAEPKDVTWPDLSFHPEATQLGHLIEPELWREAANSHHWTQDK